MSIKWKREREREKKRNLDRGEEKEEPKAVEEIKREYICACINEHMD